MGNTIKVLDGQSLLDICVIHSGSLSSLFEIMNANGLTDLTISAGTELFIPEVVNQKVVDYLIQNNLASLPVEYNTGGGSVPTATVTVKNSMNITLSSGYYQPGMSDEVVVQDSAITVNGWSFLTVPAEENVDFELKDQFGAHIIPSSIDPNGIELHMPQAPDVTINSAPFATIPTDSPYNIQLRDHLGNAITPISIAAPVVTVNTDADWIRPSDWLPIDHLVNVGDHKFVGLMAIFPNMPNVWVHSASQAFTVRVNGVATNYAAGAVARGQISFASVEDATLTSEGFKQVIIEVYPQVAPWTGTFEITSPGTVVPRANVQQYIDVRMSAPSLNNMFMNNGGRLMYLRRWVWLGTHLAMTRSLAFHSKYLEVIEEDYTKTTSAAMFQTTKLPRVMGNLNFASATTANGAFVNTWGNRTIGNISLPAATLATSFISNMYNTKTIGNISMPLVTGSTSIAAVDLESIGDVNFASLSSFVISAPNIFTIGTITTGTNLTSLSGAFNGNRLLKRVHISNCVDVTNTSTMLTSCHSLNYLFLGGLKVGFTIPPCNMTDSGFADCFNSLGIASGSQSIVIKGNITLTPATIAIATGKGFTLIT